MTTFVSSTTSPTQRNTVHKIKRKPAPTLLSPITPITPLRALDVSSEQSPPKPALYKATLYADIPSPSVISTSESTSLAPSPTISKSFFIDPRYPPPDPNDPFIPLSVLRDRNRRSSTNTMLSPYTYAAGSHMTNDQSVDMSCMNDLSSASSTKSSFLPGYRAGRTLGVSPNGLMKDQKKSEHCQKRISMCSFELYPDPPSARVVDERGEEEAWMMLGKSKKGAVPPFSASTPKKAKATSATPAHTQGHYTPHSRQRTRSSYSAHLCSPSSLSVHASHGNQHILTPAPDVHAVPGLVRDRSESSASGTSSSGTGYQSTSDPSTNVETRFPRMSTSVLNSGQSNGSQLDISDSHALTMALLSSPNKHAHAQRAYTTRSRSSSRDRSGYERDAEIERTPKVERMRKVESRNTERAASPVLKIAKFLTSGGRAMSRKNSIGSLNLLNGSSSPKVEKRKPVSPKLKSSPPSRGRERSRKLSVASMNISGPISAPVSVPLGGDIHHPEFRPQERQVTRPRSQTTAGLPPPMLPNRLGHGPSTAKASSVSVGLIGINTAATTREFGTTCIESEVEAEINREADMSRLKPWTASIPRKRSSLSLSILPIPLSPDPCATSYDDHEDTAAASQTSCQVPYENLERSLTTFECRKSKGSRESAMSGNSAESSGSSYIHVVDSGVQTFAKSVVYPKGHEDNPRTWRNPMPPRRKTDGLIKTTVNHGIAGIKFPGFRRAHTSAEDSHQETGSGSAHIRGLKISSPILRTTVTAKPQPSQLETSSIMSWVPPVNLPTPTHECVVSDSLVDAPMHTASQIHLGQARDTSANLELPTTAELETLLIASLLDENGQKIAFGDILSAAATTSEKTVIVLFLRHFWCPLDQDYVQELVDILRRLVGGGGEWKLATTEGDLRLGSEEGKKAIPQVILVSNGSPALITKYKEIFDIAGKNGPRLKISMFTDPSCRTYRMLGMENSGEACVDINPTQIPPSTRFPSTPRGSSNSPTSRTDRNGSSFSQHDAGTPLPRTDHRTPPRGHRKSHSLAQSTIPLLETNADAGTYSLSSDAYEPNVTRPTSPHSPSSTPGSPSRSYIKHASAVGGIATVVMRAIKVGMPVWEKGGVIKQLGGELVFRVKKERSLDATNSNVNVACMYAHRMSHSQDHTPFEDVLKMALTVQPSNDFVSFRPSATSLSPTSCSHSPSPQKTISKGSSPPAERSISIPLYDCDRTANSAPCTSSKPPRRPSRTDVHTLFGSTAGLTQVTAELDEERVSGDFPEYERVVSNSVLDALKDGSTAGWGHQLHKLRTRVTGKNVSDSIKAIRARDSVRTSTGSATDTSLMRAVRSVRAPKGPRMRMQSASVESLTAGGSRGTIRNFDPGMDGIESVLEFGESISSPDLSILAQSSKNLLRIRRAMDSTSTLDSSLYYDAHEGLVEIPDIDEEQNSRSAEASVVPVVSRPASRACTVDFPEI
ncbi:hypothetical protein C8R42DRAFT_726627 [Lentinula raphanica]|nr:hypothetical protein C8R42DRAFT_726627 [Lentinula raphanica]